MTDSDITAALAAIREAVMTDDQVIAYLEHVHALIKTTQAKPGDTETEHAIVAELFPGFVAAVEAVLALHQPVGDGCAAGGCTWSWPCPTYRAITAALTVSEGT